MLQKSLLTVRPETKKELVGKMDTNYVLIKSFSKGIKVILDSECSFDELLEEIEFKFRESAKFFKGSKISVSFEGRKLSLKEEKKIIQTMEANGNMSILYVCGQDDDLSFNFAKAIDFSIERNLPQYFGKVYEGSLKKGQRLECETGVIVFGDVNPGAEIGSAFIAVSLLFFAFSTVLGWNLFGKINVMRIFARKRRTSVIFAIFQFLHDFGICLCKCF